MKRTSIRPALFEWICLHLWNLFSNVSQETFVIKCYQKLYEVAGNPFYAIQAHVTHWTSAARCGDTKNAPRDTYNMTYMYIYSDETSHWYWHHVKPAHSTTDQGHWDGPGPKVHKLLPTGLGLLEVLDYIAMYNQCHDGTMQFSFTSCCRLVLIFI